MSPQLLQPAAGRRGRARLGAAIRLAQEINVEAARALSSAVRVCVTVDRAPHSLEVAESLIRADCQQ